jgi:hypothetical protein
MEPLAIVDELRAGITDAQRAEWLVSDAMAWANEPSAIARDPDMRYCVKVGDACQYEADNPELDADEPEKMIVLNDAYVDRHAPIARERIAMAGVRLAGLINRALGDQRPETSLRAQLLARIEAISRELAELKAAVETIEQ